MVKNNKKLQFLLPLVNNMSSGTEQKNKGSDKEGLLVNNHFVLI